ncbi:MAG TPA: V-type ATP synthase subunit E [Candidatus Edwardsbacteria bacterium]|nr:V-type ATP synthase subunit E [Candidatus Edwardsbacteria bacterium]
MNSELLQIIEAEAEAERQRVLAAARQQADDIVKAAEAEAAAARAQFEQGCRDQEKAARLKAESAANLKTSALLLATKSATLDTVFARAGEQLGALKGAAYQQSLQALIAEAAAGFEGRFTVRVRPDDLKAAQQIIKDLKLEAVAEADRAVPDGIVASDAAGRMMVCNRFADRIGRARPSLLSELARILWG